MARRLVSYQVSLAVVIALLTALTGGWIAWWNYRAGVRNVRELADEVFDRVADQTASGTDAFLAKAPPAADQLGYVGFSTEESRRLVATLRANPTFAWVSLSWPDGRFVGVRREGPRVMLNQSAIVNGTTTRTDSELTPDGTGWVNPQETPDTGYDPRTRPYYKLAAGARGGVWTEPYVFAGEAVPGVTYALGIRDGRELVGIYTIDFKLSRLSELTRELAFSKHGKVAIVAADGTVLGHPTATLVAGSSLVKLDAVGDPALAAASAEGGDVSLDGVPYLARVVEIPSTGWRVIVYAPESDFTAGLKERVLSSLLISLVAVVLAVGVAWMLARRVADPLEVLSAEMVRAGELRIEDDGTRRTSRFREIQHMNEALAKMKGGLRSFSRYVPRDLVRALVTQGKDAVLAGETKELTIYFSDLAGFTTLAESRTPDALVKLLGGYFDDMSQIIADERGTLDKYLGDGIMAFWGAPLEVADHALRACVAALKSQRRVKEMAATGVPFAARIGIATGDVLVGNIGSHERMNYTVMGDTANLAARLESLNKQYGTELMVNERTRELAGDQIIARPLDVVAVKGKSRGVRVFEVMALASDPADLRDHATKVAAASDTALTAYLERRFNEAAAAWADVLTLVPGDAAAELMRERALVYAYAPPPEGWTGVTTATEK